VPAANVCDTAASGYTGQFLHIEQDPSFRASVDWLPAVRHVWPIGVPDAPTALAATAGNGKVTLTWTGSAGASAYSVYRSTSSGGPYASLATGVGGASYTDLTVANGTKYYYVVRATNAKGESGSSNEVSATPQALQVPAAPTNLAAVAGRKKITLSWTGSPGATSYTIRRSTAPGGTYSAIASGVTGSTYTNSGLRTGATYYYVVAAVNAAGPSADSNQASATAR
jgi:cellulose 1,4-beta-cellobiosidase